MYSILKLNDISKNFEKILDGGYTTGNDIKNPDAIVVRSAEMLCYEPGESLVGVARAGAGYNNIPVDKMSEKGVCVFNTPGANANAVKELVLCSLLLSSRKIIRAAEWTQSLKGNGGEVIKMVEAGKKNFGGQEIMGKTLGVIGLGYIGSQVANTAILLGMNVIGFDPYLSVNAAWSVDSKVKCAANLNVIFAECDYITLHVPYLDSTKGMINAASINKMKKGVSIINLARGELVNNDALIAAVNAGKISRYVTDFPCEELLGIPGIICIPHLGASTLEAEENCAIMAAKQLKDYLENGNIVNSVNFPATNAERQVGSVRTTLVYKTDPTMIASVTAALVEVGLNIVNIVSNTRGDYSYMIVDTDAKSDSAIAKINALSGILKVRVI